LTRFLTVDPRAGALREHRHERRRYRPIRSRKSLNFGAVTLSNRVEIFKQIGGDKGTGPPNEAAGRIPRQGFALK
jgi:hypothetical protein